MKQDDNKEDEDKNKKEDNDIKEPEDGGSADEGSEPKKMKSSDDQEDAQEDETPFVSQELAQSSSFVAHYASINVKVDDDDAKSTAEQEEEEAMAVDDNASTEAVGSAEDIGTIGESVPDVFQPPDQSGEADNIPIAPPPPLAGFVAPAGSGIVRWASWPELREAAAAHVHADYDVPPDSGFHFDVPDSAAMIIHEQDAALQKALQAQREKEAQKRQAEDLEKAKKAARAAKIAEAVELLQAQPIPSLSQEEGTITMRFHTSNGTLTRRFNASQCAHDVFVFLTAQGFLPEETMVSFAPGLFFEDTNTSLKDLNLSGRFVLYVSPKKATAEES